MQRPQIIDRPQIVDTVVQWARVHAADDWMYGTPFSYWREARIAEIITEAEFREASRYYGRSWHYRGD